MPSRPDVMIMALSDCAWATALPSSKTAVVICILTPKTHVQLHHDVPQCR
jgi:hypothetical protein